MSRCHECSKVQIPERYVEHSEIRIRTWSSGLEMIRLSESGCEFCSFIRKDTEKVSTTNIRRITKDAAIVLRDCQNEIFLDFYHNSGTFYLYAIIPSLKYDRTFNIKPISVDAPIPLLRTPHDPVLHARELFEACVLSDKGAHYNCGRVNTGISAKVDQLPRRLLDLSHDDYIVTLDVPTWISTSRATFDQLSDYCTLSYRWGQGPPDCFLSTQSLGDRVLPLESLPQTFKDAIIVARALKLRFIWIDAMCIVQPSAHGDFTDWNAEGSRMWMVYQNAVCNIAATCSSNPDEGFLSRVGIDFNAPCGIPEETKDGATQRMFLPGLRVNSLYYESVVMSSLNSRGWVAQERLLSRRILHFTEERVFWDCKAVGVTKKALGFDPEFNHWFQHASLLTFKEWLLFIQLYSRSCFTQLTDRLIALSSIARSVPAELFGTTYFAGIWGERAVECLSWSSAFPCSTDLRRRYLDLAPSWSWASVPDKIRYLYMDIETRITLVQLEVEFPGLVQASSLIGTRGQGALKFVARLSSMSLPTHNTQQEMFEDLDIQQVSSIVGRIFWDESQDLGVAESVYHVVPLRMSRGSDHSTEYLVSLIVVSQPSISDGTVSGSCKVYRRIGYLELKSRWKYDEKDRMYKAPDHDLFFNAVFPSATEQSIVII